MRKASVIICTLALATLLFTNNAIAVDFGFYFDIGNGSGEAEIEDSVAGKFDIDTEFKGLGFQFETNPLTANNVFSYRFQAGYELRDIEDDSDTELDLDGILINNTFAFGGNPFGKTRLWGGPQVLVGYYSGESEESYLGEKISFTGFGFGFGIAGGANFGLGSGNTILTTTIGIRYFGFAGEAEHNDQNDTLSGNATEFFISVGMLF